MNSLKLKSRIQRLERQMRAEGRGTAAEQLLHSRLQAARKRESEARLKRVRACMTRLYPTANSPRRVPDRKGKKGFQGKETVGCVPLGHRRTMPPIQKRPLSQEALERSVAKCPVRLQVEGSPSSDLYFACYLQVKEVRQVFGHAQGPLYADATHGWKEVRHDEDLPGWLARLIWTGAPAHQSVRVLLKIQQHLESGL